MKKLFISICLFAMTSLVNAASQDTQLTLIWQVSVAAKVRFPGRERACLVAAAWHTEGTTCHFYPRAGSRSPICILFEKVSQSDTEEIDFLNDQKFNIAIPPAYASWDALPTATKIIIGICCNERKLKAKIKLPEISLQISGG